MSAPLIVAPTLQKGPPHCLNHSESTSVPISGVIHVSLNGAFCIRASHLSLHCGGMSISAAASDVDDVEGGGGDPVADVAQAGGPTWLLLSACRGRKSFSNRARKLNGALKIRLSGVPGTAAVRAGVAQAAAVSVKICVRHIPSAKAVKANMGRVRSNGHCR